MHRWVKDYLRTVDYALTRPDVDAEKIGYLGDSWGAFNGLILPIGFTIVVWVAWMRRDLLGGYRYPLWLKVIALAVWLLTLYLGWMSLSELPGVWS